MEQMEEQLFDWLNTSRIQKRSLYFNGHNLLSPAMTLGSTQPLTEMSTRKCFWGVKGVRGVR
jgi:hypothetical protein